MIIENLLKEISGTLKKYKEIEKVTGANFNFFKIFKLEKLEVKHSLFLGELLNPKGSHGLGAELLIQFVKIFNIPNFNEEDCLNSNLICEKGFGKVSVSEGKMTGGRVDIEIISGKKGIVIENKIYAVDGIFQLIRIREAYPNASLIYLTLTGYSPSEQSAGSLVEDVDYTCKSYETDILKWLIICREKAILLPILRECISQYINLVKFLTHQSINKMEDNEIQKSILESAQTFESAKNIASQLKKLENDIFDSCWKQLSENWLKKYGLIEFELFEFNGFSFLIKISKEENSGGIENEYFHIDLWPRRTIDKTAGFASQKELIIFREIAKLFKDRPLNSFVSGNYYTVRVTSEFDLPNLKFEEYKILHENKSEWIKNVMNEAGDFIKHIVDALKLMGNPNIIINPKFQ